MVPAAQEPSGCIHLSPKYISRALVDGLSDHLVIASSATTTHPVSCIASFTMKTSHNHKNPADLQAYFKGKR